MFKFLYGFFKNKKVLVTGHTGFKGSWLSIWLNEMGAKVTGYSLPPKTERDNYILSGIEKKITSIIGDIRDYDSLTKVIIKEKPEIVFHLAAQPIVLQSYQFPRETYETNIMGTVNLLESLRVINSVKSIIVITSDKCYENKEWTWGYRESDPVGGYDPYSSSKGAVEIVANAYYKSFFKNKKVGLATARAGNVIGGGDWAEFRIMPDCVRSLLSSKPIEIRNPGSNRPWQHVFEPLSGYLLLAYKLNQNFKEYSGPWNFGPEYSSVISVKELVQKVIKYWGSGKLKDISKAQNKAKHEARALSLDISKARNELNWSPLLSVDEAVKLTIEWYRQKKIDYNFCVSQIKKYINFEN